MSSRRCWRLTTISLLVLVGALTGCSTVSPAPVNPAPAPTAAGSGQRDADEPRLTSQDADAWLDGLLPSLLEREGVAGAIVTIVSGGETVTRRGYGYATVGEGGREAAVPVDPDETLFRIGSISKTFTAATVLRLQERGVVDIDEPIEPHLDFELPTRFDEPITLRHLLTHTAGFEDRLDIVQGGSAPGLRASVAHDVPRQIFEPGTTPAYSNYGNGLAAYVLERVTGRAYEDLLQDEVLDVVGMPSTTIAQPPGPERAALLSEGYRDLRSAPLGFETTSPAPAGAISASASDMGAFMLALLGGTGDNQLLTPETLALMQRPSPDLSARGALAAADSMALGLYEQNRNGRRILTHGGDLVAFHSEMQLYPQEGAGIFVSVNSVGVDDYSTVALRELLMSGFADRYFPSEDEQQVVEATAAEHAAVVAGDYASSRRFESTFLRLYNGLTPVSVSATRDGELTVSALVDPSGEPVVLTEVEPWVWQEIGGQRRLAAHVADGEVQALSFHPTMVLEPMPTTWTVAPLLLGGGTLVLLVTVGAWPVAAAARRRHGAPLTATRAERLPRWSTLAAAVLALLGVGLWVVVAVRLLSSAAAPDLLIRAAQLSTLLGSLGALPALWRLHVSARTARSGRWFDIAVLSILVVGFLAFATGAVAGGLLIPDISY